MSPDPLAAYAVHQRRCNLSTETIRRRRVVLRAFADWLGRDLLGATREDIEDWLDLRPRAPQTRRAYVNDLRAFYRWATAEELVAADPSLRVVRPRLPRGVPRPLSDRQVLLALETASVRVGAMLSLAAFEGLRVQEIAGLRGDDVDLTRGLLLVTHGKGQHERVVPLHPEALLSLVRFGLPAVGFVFTNRAGRPLLPTTVGGLISRHLRAQGIDATAHQLRHWFATSAYQLSGGDLRLVQDLLGHASPTTTAIYSAWAPGRAAEVIGRLTAGG